MREAVPLVRQGIVTGASGRNWASYGDSVILPADFPDWRRNLLTDPQTSGGLLIACAAERADAILQSIVEAGYPAAAASAGPRRVRLPCASRRERAAASKRSSGRLDRIDARGGLCFTPTNAEPNNTQPMPGLIIN